MLLLIALTFILCNYINPIFSTEESKQIHYITKDGNVNIGIYSDGKLKGIDDYIVWGLYDNQINQTGWAQLEVHTNPNYTDTEQSYYAGFIEGILTWELIGMNWRNNIEDYCIDDHQYCQRLFKFISDGIEFSKSQINKHRHNDSYWHNVGLTFEQLTGLDDGYKYITNKSMKLNKIKLNPRIDIDTKGIILLNLLPEFGVLEQVLNRSQRAMNIEDGHCSAIIKPLSDGSDIFVAHNTWIPYQMMLRIMKKYTFNFRKIAGHTVSFPSYPGSIFSMDDYYVISSGLLVMETTIGNFNSSLWQYVNADKMVFEFIRNIVANRLANSGKEWTEIFAKFNSGTYNNQFMIIDYNKYKRGMSLENLPDDLLWIIEQEPGYVRSGDVTDVLRQHGYWSSYNIPYFPEIYHISKYDYEFKTKGDFFSHENAPRAKIFRRDQSKVTDLKTLYKLMRYNDFKNDPLSRCNCTPPYSSENTLSARNDLNDPNGTYPIPLMKFRPTGAIDAKIVNFEMFWKNQMIAVSGPTNDQQPTFQWSTTKISGVKHEGQPDKWSFSPVHVQWLPLKTLNVVM